MCGGGDSWSSGISNCLYYDVVGHSTHSVMGHSVKQYYTLVSGIHNDWSSVPECPGGGRVVERNAI